LSSFFGVKKSFGCLTAYGAAKQPNDPAALLWAESTATQGGLRHEVAQFE
jgi:hypothetical protein